MKLLIGNEMAWELKFEDNPEANREDYEVALADLAELAKHVSLLASFTVDETSARVVIQAQKVTLDEIAMNQFFFELLTQLFDLDLGYASLGGAGCDFALEIVNATPRY